jgi:hypothetical protein
MYGLAIIAVDDEEEVKFIVTNDPATTINRWEYHSMMAVTPGTRLRFLIS